MNPILSTALKYLCAASLVALIVFVAGWHWWTFLICLLVGGAIGALWDPGRRP